jgi:probable HAF family extracellular repeat protein
MANDINDNGQAVGTATSSGNGDRAVVWTIHP